MPPETQSTDIPTLIRQLERDRAALSRLLTLYATVVLHAGDFVTAGLKTLPKNVPPEMIAVTGSGGVGKSSLLGELTAHFARRGEYVGVLACDPESPLTGGALLGDRCRIIGPRNRSESLSEAYPPRRVNSASHQHRIDAQPDESVWV